MTLTFLDFLAVLVAAASLWIVREEVERRRRARGYPLPPGPKGLPIIGNLLQIPVEKAWLGYEKLRKEYGDMIYLDAMGQPILVLGSAEKVQQIMEKNSSITSERPTFHTVELMGLGWITALLQHDQRWRGHRRVYQRQIGPAGLQRFNSVFDEEISDFLRNVERRPDELSKYIRDLFGLIVIRMAYGFADPAMSRSLIEDGETLIKAFSDATVPGKYLVNDIPILKYVPAWFPGAGFRRRFDELKVVTTRVLDDAFERVRQEMSSGNRRGGPNMAEDLIANTPIDTSSDAASRSYENVAKEVCAVTYSGGSDTVNATISALFLGLAMHPKVQKKAQEELDSVIGQDRLPDLTDRDSLPYISAVVKETNRWHTTAPLGLPHVLSQDAVFDGRFVPKGTYVMANIWAILHDPEAYPNPSQFNPGRYLKDGKLDPDVRDPNAFAFGFGRRACAGKLLADELLFLVTARVLWTFNVSPRRDELGNDVALKLDPTSETISYPGSLDVDIEPRSQSHAKLLAMVVD